MTEVRRDLVVGNGMLATAFRATPGAVSGHRIHFASGVSNSSCVDSEQFARERRLLLHSLGQCTEQDQFVYFGTCAAEVPGSEDSPYVRHKVAMEALVLAQANGRVARLPQVAGPNASPHTLLAVLCNRIRSGIPVVVQERATRNIIDVADVVRLVDAWLSAPGDQPNLINIGNTQSYPVQTIVDTIESVLGMQGRREVVAAGVPYDVDTSAMVPFISQCGVTFDGDYLARTIARYYK